MPNSFEVPLFGTITPSQSECWESSIEHDGDEVSIALVIDSETYVDPNPIERAAATLNRFDELAQSTFTALLADLSENGEDSAVQLYRQHHLAELSDEELASFGDTSSWPDDAEAFLKHLSLIHI